IIVILMIFLLNRRRQSVPKQPDLIEPKPEQEPIRRKIKTKKKKKIKIKQHGAESSQAISDEKEAAWESEE
ncbi:MAG: hypothetical protein KAJ51_16070, partial [Thermoplasmata archaeon]|nr:hypothetical protein [Thermoplasmata archaeon]